MITPNTIVGGRYRVVKPLGGGGMKLVYLAEDLRLVARPCALAEMVDGFTDPNMQQQAVAAFQREADMLAQLSNEHIPRIFDRFNEQNRHYLVMEYIDGTTLEGELKKAGGGLDQLLVIDIALQILDTLDYLHGLNPPVIYRDLKPSNVMVGAQGRVKLIDFGIARFFAPQGNVTMIGTQGYAPPEQYRGAVELRSDLYALGATMHHALCGRDPATQPPFSFPRLSEVSPDIDPELAALVDQAVSYQVEKRPASAAEFKRRLFAVKVAVLSGPSRAPAQGFPPPAGVPQLKLPSASAGAPMLPSPSAPTMLSTEIPCPYCRRRIPGDSRFCSFCAADLRRVLGPDEVAAIPEAGSQSLGATGGMRLGYPRPRSHWPGRADGLARLRKPVFLLMALFLGGFLIAEGISWMVQQATQPTVRPPSGYVPRDYPGAPSYPGSEAPGAPEARYRSRQEIALRRLLDEQDYRSVQFRIAGGDVELWGTVPTEADRAMVHLLVFTVTGIPSFRDHIQSRDFFAGP